MTPTFAGLAIGCSGALASTAANVLTDASLPLTLAGCAAWAAIGAATRSALHDDLRRWP
jgi:hypothetical protein